uniref:substrate-binding domain-containing protein n=1 Tax=Streptomyces alfalfae TaxID=1642299 RepID=UPI00281172BE
IAEGQFGAVTLTTISPDKQAIARLAVESLLRSLAGGAEPGGRVLTARFRLVERESTLGRR